MANDERLIVSGVSLDGTPTVIREQRLNIYFAAGRVQVVDLKSGGTAEKERLRPKYF